MKSAKEEITVFLRKFKEVATSNGNKSFTICCRPEYKITIAHLGITVGQTKQEILNLTYEDYMNGPEQDHQKKNSKIWEFGIILNGEEIYIKLSDDFSEGVAICISFHLAGYPINCPYKNS